MEYENVVHIHNLILFIHEEKWKYATYKKNEWNQKILLSEVAQAQNK